MVGNGTETSIDRSNTTFHKTNVIVNICNKHIPVGVLLNGEPLIVVHINIFDYYYILMAGRSYRYKTVRY